ncbi:MAG: efflux RND transporter periplasmic adaptor subunit [Verrucomicrobia bacterium]|nr:efflux RND transporter periplasmic adaptor subunit [Verrucomicrobiota bacterium]
MSLLKKSIKVIIPILIILVALMIGRTIIKTTKKPKKNGSGSESGTFSVETMPLKAGLQPVKLRATGTVAPALAITLRARVAGEIIEVAPEFIDGGSFKKGELMLKIDPVDYQLALEQKKAALAEAEFQLKLEEGQRDIAAREWELLEAGNGASEADRELALRVPHMKYRIAKLEAAKAELENAELDLVRTEIRAPFNAVVVERKTDLGTQVNLQDALATLSGSDEFYVRASIPVDRLQWIECDPENGSAVTIVRNTGEVRKGRAIRLESALEEKGRMARVLVAVKNPLEGDQPLLLNEYVRMQIEGSAIEKAFHIPRLALHDDRFVWLAKKDRTLEIREVEVRWRDATDVIVTGGLANGEQLILTNLSTPVNGMKLRLPGDPMPQPSMGGGKGGGKPDMNKPPEQEGKTPKPGGRTPGMGGGKGKGGGNPDQAKETSQKKDR